MDLSNAGLLPHVLWRDFGASCWTFELLLKTFLSIWNCATCWCFSLWSASKLRCCCCPAPRHLMLIWCYVQKSRIGAERSPILWWLHSISNVQSKKRYLLRNLFLHKAMTSIALCRSSPPERGSCSFNQMASWQTFGWHSWQTANISPSRMLHPPKQQGRQNHLTGNWWWTVIGRFWAETAGTTWKMPAFFMIAHWLARRMQMLWFIVCTRPQQKPVASRGSRSKKSAVIGTKLEKWKLIAEGRGHYWDPWR